MATTLRTGVETPSELIAATMLTLRTLLTEHPIAFYELVTASRNPGHELWGGTPEILDSFAMTERGRVHDTVRDIVLAAVEGDGFGMTLRSPIALPGEEA